MIKKLNIQNFQSHKDSTLNFDKGMNVIVGQSDSGKTAIIRALKFAIWNKPGGNDFRSNWGGNTSVEIITKEHSIKRSKVKNENIYKLNDLKPFKAFGTNVPDEILQALNTDAINLQQQMDSPFLLKDTSGNVAAHFNKIAKLDKIDEGLKYIQSHIYSITKNIAWTKDHISEKNEQLEEFIDLNQFEKDIEKAEELQLNLQRTEHLLNELIKTSDRLQLIDTAIIKKSKILPAEKAIDKALALIQQKKEIIQKHKNLKELSIGIYYLQKDIEIAENGILAESTVDKILQMYQNIRKSRVSLTEIRHVYETIIDNEKGQERALKQLSKLEKEYKIKFPEICPLCGTKIK